MKSKNHLPRALFGDDVVEVDDAGDEQQGDDDEYHRRRIDVVGAEARQLDLRFEPVIRRNIANTTGALMIHSLRESGPIFFSSLAAQVTVSDCP